MHDDGGADGDDTVLVPAQAQAQARATVYANAVPGLANATFQTRVTAGQPLVVERATYWPGTSGSSLTGGGDEAARAEALAFAGQADAGAVAAGVAAGDLEVGVSGPDAGVAAARPYLLLEVAPVGVVSTARAAGQVSGEEQAVLDRVAQARAAFLANAPPGTQRGVAPPIRMGGTQGVAAGGGASTTAIALPWSGGHLTLGRIQ